MYFLTEPQTKSVTNYPLFIGDNARINMGVLRMSKTQILVVGRADYRSEHAYKIAHEIGREIALKGRENSQVNNTLAQKRKDSNQKR